MAWPKFLGTVYRTLASIHSEVTIVVPSLVIVTSSGNRSMIPVATWRIRPARHKTRERVVWASTRYWVVETAASVAPTAPKPRRTDHSAIPAAPVTVTRPTKAQPANGIIHGCRLHMNTTPTRFSSGSRSLSTDRRRKPRRIAKHGSSGHAIVISVGSPVEEAW
jgi:hypothetical protein